MDDTRLLHATSAVDTAQELLTEILGESPRSPYDVVALMRADKLLSAAIIAINEARS